MKQSQTPYQNQNSQQKSSCLLAQRSISYQVIPQQQNLTPTKCIEPGQKSVMTIEQKSPSPLSSQQNKLRGKSNTVRNYESQSSSKNKLQSQNNKTESMTQRKKQNLSISQNKSRTNPNPVEVKSLISENKMLKDEIMLLQQLIQDVVPVFSKFTEDIEEDSQTINLQLSQPFSLPPIKKQQGRFNQQEMIFLQQSLQHLKQAYDNQQHKSNLVYEVQENEDSDFLEAEDLDQTTTDERQQVQATNPLQSTAKFFNIKSSFLTFGQKDDSTLDPSTNATTKHTPTNGLSQLQYKISQKIKITDLNKQSKNFNMPVSIENSHPSSTHSSVKREIRKIIDFDEIQKLKGIIEKINNSQILQDIKSRKGLSREEYSSKNVQQIEKDSPLDQSRNLEVLQSNYSSANLSGNSSMFDDETSIPTDQFIHNHLVCPSAKIPSSLTINQDTRQSSVKKFNEKSIEKTKQSIQLINQQVRHNPSRAADFFYPKILSDSINNFNTCNSISSSSSEDELQQLPEVQDDNILNELQQENIVNQEKPNHDYYLTPSDQVLHQFKSQDTPLQIKESQQVQKHSHGDQVEVQVLEQSDNIEEKNLEQTPQRIIKDRQDINDQQRYAHYIREYNFDNQKDISSQQNMGEEYFSKEGAAFFTSSLLLTDQQLNSKRGSIDPLLYLLMKNESPFRDKQNQDSIQQSEQNEIGTAIGMEDSQKLNKNLVSENQCKSRQSLLKPKTKNSFKRDKENNKSGSQNNQQIYTQRDNQIQLNQKQGTDDSIPHLQTLNIQQEAKPSLDVSSKSNALQPISYSLTNGKNSQISSINHSPQSKKQIIITHKVDYKRGRSQSQYDNLSQNITTRQNRNQPQIQKWSTTEEKEKDLVITNQEIIKRSIESNKSLKQINLVTVLNIPNIRNTGQIAKIQQPTEDTLEKIDSTLIQLTDRLSSQRDKKEEQEAALTIESFSIQPILIQIEADNNSRNNNQSLKQSTGNNSQSIINESKISINNSQNRYQRLADGIKTQRLQEIQQRDKFLETYKQQHLEQTIREIDQLSTPSPRVLDANVCQHQISFQNLQIYDEDILKTKLQDDKIVARSKVQSKSSMDQQVSSYYYSKDSLPETETIKSSKMENLMQEYINEQLTYNQRHSDAYEQLAQQQVRLSISPGIYKMSQLSSEEELIEVSAPDLGYDKRFSYYSNTMQQHRVSPIRIHEYMYSNQNQMKANIIEEYELEKIQPTKSIQYYEVQNHQSKNQNQNSIINEEPSLEEQESNFQNTLKHQFSIQSADRAVNQSQDQSSKVSLTNIDMADSEIFSIQYKSQQSNRLKYSSNLKSSQQNQILSQSKAIVKSPFQSLGNTSRYSTPLKQFINQEIFSSKVTSPAQQQQSQSNLSNCKSLSTNTKNMLQTLLISPQAQSTTTPSQNLNEKQQRSINKSPIFKTIDQTANSSSQRTPIKSQEQNMIIRRSLNLDYLKTQRLKLQSQQTIDPSRDKNNSLSRCDKNQSSQKKPSFNRRINRASVQIASQFDSKEGSMTPSLKSSAIIRKNQNSQTRQNELEIKLKEKEERIKLILQKKKDQDMKINQNRINKEKSISMNSVSSARNDSKICLKNGSALLRTPSKLSSKIILKKDFVTTSKQTSMIVTDQLISDFKRDTFSTLDINTISSNQKGNGNNSNNIESQTIVGPITERICPVNLKETMSPLLMSVQPTLKQKEFFKKIETDCQQRRNKVQAYCRVDQLALMKNKQEKQQQEL